MTRVCCVVQCGVKSGNQENRTALFQISNSDSESYNRVLNAVGSHLKQSKCPPKNLFICELHFAEECILRTDINVMTDGSELVVPRKRPRLKKNSVPTIFPDVAVIKKRLKQGAVPQFLTNQGQIKMEQDIPFELVIVKEEKVEEMDSTEHQQTNINNVLLIKEENIKIEQELDSEVIVKEENVEET
ncbi:uncharacterized protein LOC123295396 isoform X1 [Chrysoperla carnea]|uniref:uncharacterized protein LOC123295396 isoform X1 n=1 Tax=Chrysoperla carnea TaxID=189513 RepID=UPI001D091695|nr:uncharacterized protein LOC123295396 isoform X1 [Chrysoperla carnea]